MKIAAVFARVILAIIYFLYGLNFFVHFIPTNLPGGKAGDFEGGLIHSGFFFQYMKGMQIAGSLLLLANRLMPLVLVVLFPISLNIFLFHLFLLTKGLATAVVLFAANCFLLYAYRRYYQTMLQAVTPL